LGRIVLILLLTVAVEFGASTWLYERASQFSVREDAAHRLAEHLVIARKLIAERPPAARGVAARALVTDRYDVGWSAQPPDLGRHPRLAAMERQIVGWEPSLAATDLRVRLLPLTAGSAIVGEFRLPDGSWVQFRTRGRAQRWSFAVERVLLALLPATLLLLVSTLLVRFTLRPLRTLIRAIGRVGSGKQVTVAEEGIAEVRGLIHAFNAMQERIHDLIESRTQALAAVGHDLRTPLSRLQLRLDRVADDDAREAMADDVREIDTMLASLLTFLAGDQDPEVPVATDLAVLLETLVDGAADRGRDARYVGPEHLEWTVRPSLLRRAVSNLIENALHYADSVTVTLTEDPVGVVIAVEDDGPGIAPDQLDAALRPFTRLDDARARSTQGLGLGLAIVAQAVAQEHGRLTLANRPQGGLRAAIRLPRAAAATFPHAGAAPQQIGSPNS
jgi:two-component system, OmpR family, osmolarity sensor histidine kinase EnvZ